MNPGILGLEPVTFPQGCLSALATVQLVLPLGSGVWGDGSSGRPDALGEQRGTQLMSGLSLDLTRTGHGHSRCLQ